VLIRSATMPQFLFMPKQQSAFSKWALTTVVPAVFLLLEACNAPNPGPAQLGACLALAHGFGQPCKRSRSVWSIRQVGGGNLLALACNTACTQASTHVHTAYMHSSHTACTELMCTWLAHSIACTTYVHTTGAWCLHIGLHDLRICGKPFPHFLMPLCCTGTCCCTFDCEERGGNPS